MKNKISKQMECYKCGKPLNRHLEDYPYLISGLSNVVLPNTPIYRCSDLECGSYEVEITSTRKIHIIITVKILFKLDGLIGPEIRFLRKELDVTTEDWAIILDLDEQKLIDLEKQNSKIDFSLDKNIREKCLEIIEDMIGESKQINRMKNHIKNILSQLSDLSKGNNPQYYIDPKDSQNEEILALMG